MLKNDPYAELLQLTAKGDEKAFSRLYELTSPRLYNLCLQLMKTGQLAEEILQEGFVKIWQNAATFDPTRAQAMTWMTTIVRNRGLDVLRSHKSRPHEVDAEFEGMEFSSPDFSPHDEASMSLSAQAVQKCMKDLKEEQQKSIMMAYYYGYTHEEIAATLKSPLGTVKAWVRRGIERLRKCLG